MAQTATFMGVRLIHPQSTIGYIVLRNGEREFTVPCDLRMTCSALLAAFGDVDVKGRARIRYQLDGGGALLSFEPEGAGI
jgi:hypothetical protein